MVHRQGLRAERTDRTAAAARAGGGDAARATLAVNGTNPAWRLTALIWIVDEFIAASFAGTLARR